jgi:hypothetical protein
MIYGSTIFLYINIRSWYPFDSNFSHKWDFPYAHCIDNYDCSIMYYAADEWRKMFDAWKFFCFKIPGFEIVRTPTMGLGSSCSNRLNFAFKIINFLLLVSRYPNYS